MKDILKRLRRIDVRLVLAAIFAMVLLHVTIIFTAPSVARSSAWDRLSPALKPNTMIVFPATSPEAQLLPYLAPDTRLALCKFDTRKGQVAVTATLPGPGWSLTLYDTSGAAIYVAAGRPDRPSPLSLLLVPDDARFMGLTPEALGRRSPRQNQLRVQAREGLAVLRAPDAGYAYRARLEAELNQAVCRRAPQGT